MNPKPSQNTLIKLELLPQHRTATATIYLMFFFSKASKTFELLMQGANPKAVTCWRTTLTSPEELLRDAFAISTMAETQDLWQNTENSSEFPYLYLRGTCLSLNVLGLRGGSQGQHLKQSHVPKASALGLTPQGKMCL